MFSYFNEGISDCVPSKKISIEKLIKEIRQNNNPNIQAIRALDPTDEKYDARKRQFKVSLPNITPCCTVSYRNDKSIVEFNGYMYFDIDKLEDAENLKNELVAKYREYICMMCVSCSGRGLSFLVKVENEVTVTNFTSIREYLSTHIFPDLKLDPQTKSKSNAWYISYDPNCYYNPSSVVDIPEQYLHDQEKKLNKSAKFNIINSSPDCLKTALYHYESIHISEVLKKLKFKTEVPVKNRIFDLYPIDYCEVYLPPNYKIPDGSKKLVFSHVIHNLVYLNPDVEPDYIFSYIKWLNQTKTVTPAVFKDLIRHFNYVYYTIKNTGEIHPQVRIKYFHCRPDTISVFEKKRLGKRMTALYKKSETINLITYAKQLLEIVVGA